MLMKNERGVSPVIAVILMVAITVVLAAVVYVWVSGFSGEQGGPARSLSLSYSGHTGDEWNWTIASATPGLEYADLSVTIDGDAATWRHTGDGIVGAGDTLTLESATSLSGMRLRVVDVPANSVILTLTVP